MLKLILLLTLLTGAYAQEAFEAPVESEPQDAQWSHEGEPVAESYEGQEEVREPASEVPAEEQFN